MTAPARRSLRATIGGLSVQMWTSWKRRLASRGVLRGEGLEVGALHRPLAVSRRASVRYVDRMDVETLRRHYPELNDAPLVTVDVIDDGERLASVADASQDFLIANHFLEHTQDPIGTLQNHLRVLRPGGHLYLAVPLKDASFDVRRPVTSIEHLLRDHRDGPEGTLQQHYEEWATLVDGSTPEQLDERVADLRARDYSIHFHVWDEPALLELMAHLQAELQMPFTVKRAQRNHYEMIMILQKTPATGAR
ncbi:MAG: methyltransferase domain-containing protein [Solirubrobacteraceae bacterium]